MFEFLIFYPICQIPQGIYCHEYCHYILVSLTIFSLITVWWKKRVDRCDQDGLGTIDRMGAIFFLILGWPKGMNDFGIFCESMGVINRDHTLSFCGLIALCILNFTRELGIKIRILIVCWGYIDILLKGLLKLLS